MNFGSGAAHSIYGRSYTMLPGSFQAYISSVRRWDEVWRRFVNVVEFGLAGMAINTVGEVIATRRVSQFELIVLFFISLKPTCALALFLRPQTCSRGAVAQQTLPDRCLCVSSTCNTVIRHHHR